MDYSNIIMANYDISNILKIETINNGNINKTYIVYTNNNKYIFQKLSKEVFKNPYKVMKNIESVTNFLKDKKVNETLNIIYTKDNKFLLEIYQNGEKEYYRLYNYIENKVSYNRISDKNIAY